MKREFYLDLASRRLRMPIGTDLVLHEHPDAEAIMHDAERLGRVVEQTALRYGTPLAFPLMDLRLEKADLLSNLGMDEAGAEVFQFTEDPGAAAIARVEASPDAPFSRRNQAHIDAITYIAEKTALVPMGMAIGPFSLMTKLISDPITPMAMAGMGVTADEDPGIRTVETCLRLAELAVRRSLAAQMRAGARAVLVCEPAANTVYLSPKQVDAGSDIFERFVMRPWLRIKQQFEDAGVDLVFHNCGALSDFMVEQFATRLHPVILSLGSTRVLWDDARLVPKDVVLFGNMPTKSFYSDSTMSLERVEALSRELVEKMKATGHPFIFSSECDVLHVPDAAETIRRKVDAMLAVA